MSRAFATSLLHAAIYLSFAIAALRPALAASPTVVIDTPQPPPEWALLQRELLRANTAACREFFHRYFDERGYLLCVERWGGDDGPDDAIENCLCWPILHAAGADDIVLHLYKKAWEGHLRQYTAARTVQVPFARDGMYYKEFPVMFDWLHNSEGLTVFNLQGLSDPYDDRFQTRARRFAGFYMNEDPQAPNYDPAHRIIRSMINGSRGPMLRKATALDWAGDPIEVEGRFQPAHGERNYEEMLAHFKDYNDVAGDHPSNLMATCLALNAYMLRHEPKYKQWILEYVDAWRERMDRNGGVIPSNIGLDGTIGGETEGKWYGGVYGWGFTVIVPQTGRPIHRSSVHLGLQGFLNAFLLTGDDRYLDGWRKQIDLINAQARTIDGRTQYPSMYGDDGWYGYSPRPYDRGAFEIWYMSMQPDDRERVGSHRWIDYLEGRNPAYPVTLLRAELARIRRRVQGMRADPTTPDTRLADDPMKFNPASVQSFVELAMGGVQPTKNGLTLHCRLRYFDPIRRRAGLPPDVAALIEQMQHDRVAVSLVNVNQLEPRTVVIQAGGYAEHQFTAVSSADLASGGRPNEVDADHLQIKLEPGCGARLVLQMNRYVNQPTLVFPWDR